MVIENPRPGAPEWWLKRLAYKILDRQPRYDLLERYVIGDHPLPLGDDRYVKALREMQRKARTNYYGLVTMAPVERMKINGFRFGSTEGEADKDAEKFWMANDMDLQSRLVHLCAATFGDMYVMVSPPEDGGDIPVITAEDPRWCATEADPRRRTLTRAGLRMWQDDMEEKILAVLLLPDQIWYAEGPSVDPNVRMDKATLTGKLFGNGPDAFKFVGSMPNKLGEVPIVRFPWIPSFNDTSLGEAEMVMDIQDRINGEILHRLIISKAQAYKQRMISGVSVPQQRGRGRKPPFDPGSDAIWIVESPDAKPFEFKEADLTQLLAAVRDDVGDMAAITKTPPHYLLGEVVNVSGDALKAAEGGLVSKTRERMTSCGWSWEKVQKLCFKYRGDSRAEEPLSETIWADPEVKSRAELADAAVKENSLGIPLQLTMERLGYAPGQITFAVEEKKKNELRQAAMMQAAANAAGAKPGAPNPNQKVSNGNPNAGKSENGDRSGSDSGTKR